MTEEQRNPIPQDHDPHAPGSNETGAFARTAVRSIFPLLVCASVSLGWWVPLFYDWSGANQSHAPPIVGYVFRGLLVAFALTILALPLLPKLQRIDPVRNPLIQPFGFRVALIIVATMMAGLFVYRDATLVVIDIVSVIYPILCAVKLGMVSPSIRWRIVSLYSCLYLPFVWVCGNDVILGEIKRGSLSFVPLLAGAPALLCSLYVGRIVGHHEAIAMTSAVLVAGLEIIVGLWIIQLGARRAIACQLLLLAVSVVMSFGLHALMSA